jgi:hypothetical protein
VKRTQAILALVVGLAVLAAACTGDDGNGDAGGAGATAGATGDTGEIGPTPVQSGSVTVGTYEYANAGLRAVLELDGHAGTLEVDNGTDHDLPDPGFYARHALTGARTDGVVSDPSPIPAGDSGSFLVELDEVTVGDVGVIGLLFGGEDYGLFVRTA